jgi:O-acetylhomoserine/O-acetylserine sulfhydrylase-like pyridoxal-dependent enzyme
VSCLLVVFIPGLLMLATFGLERLEARLDRDRTQTTDVAEFLDRHRLERIESVNQAVNRAATNGSSHAPTSAYNWANPQFQQTRHVDPV